MQEVMTRVCRVCGKENPADLYYGRDTRCKPCKKVYDHARQSTEEAKARRKERRAVKAAKLTPEQAEELRAKQAEYSLARYRREQEKRVPGFTVKAKKVVHTPLPLPKDRVNQSGDIRKMPPAPPAVPERRKFSTYGIEQLWSECPESRKEWYAVLKEEGVPASSPLYAHPMHDKYVPGKAAVPAKP